MESGRSETFESDFLERRESFRSRLPRRPKRREQCSALRVRWWAGCSYGFSEQQGPLGNVPAGVACSRRSERPAQNGEDEIADRFDICLAFTLREEGSYVDDPSDPGGATNMGITLATYRQWSDNPNLGDVQVKDLTLKTAKAIYRSLYWNPLRADALPPGVDLSVFDMGVNAGIWRSARLLQQALGFTGDEVDGSIGPETMAAVGRFDDRRLVNNLADRQAAYYRSLADFSTFGTGWLNRTDARRAAALAMIEGAGEAMAAA